jgi:plastocyanin
MRRRGRVVAVAATLLAAGASAVADAASGPAGVDLQFEAFAPSLLDVLPGESVQWSNVSERTHTVTFDDGSYDSGELGPGSVVLRRFDQPGAFPFHCTLHPGMVGEVDVRRVILDVLPPAAVPAGQRVQVTGRTANPAVPVTVQREGDRGPQAVARAVPAADGTWSVAVTATAPVQLRAVAGDDVSQTRRLLVSDRRVVLRRARGGVAATVTPAFPGARVRLDVRRRERFGWWPTATRRLDYLSRAGFRVLGRARVRVVLVDRDGWTPLATSRSLRLRS